MTKIPIFCNSFGGVGGNGGNTVGGGGGGYCTGGGTGWGISCRGVDVAGDLHFSPCFSLVANGSVGLVSSSLYSKSMSSVVVSALSSDFCLLTHSNSSSSSSLGLSY